MIAATKPMAGGIDRIAIMVAGKIVSAPVVQFVPLGKKFVISGLKDEDEPAKLAARLMGKTEEQINLAADEAKIRQKEQSKVGAPESTNLIIEEPESDKAAAETNHIARIEGLKISLKPGKLAPSDFDYIQIANALQGLAKAFPESTGIDPECEMISLISKRIPELALLSKNSKGKKIPLASLETILEPYVRGDKPLK